MPTEVLEELSAWVLASFVYPGLLFGVALSLAGDWAFGVVRPVLVPRIYRTQTRPRSILRPLYDFLKLAGRLPPVYTALDLDRVPTGAGRASGGSLGLLSALAPVMALALLPFPGSPIVRAADPAGDLVLVLALLLVQPLCSAALRLNDEGIDSLRGAHDIGKLLVGLFPTLVAVAALVEVAGSRSLQLTALSAAPETASQALVRALSGVALLIALPWWLGWKDSHASYRSAGVYAGRLLQGAALAAFWASLVLPAPGDFLWALLVVVGGALFAYVAMRAVSERWAPGMRERDAARLVWATAFPAAAVSLAAAFWSGAI